MVALGLWNELKLHRLAPEGAFLNGGEQGEVFLPLREVPPGSKPGQTFRVFVYLDAEDCYAASTRTPLAQRGDVTLLEIRSVTKLGALLEWGLPQGLLLPWQEVKRDQKRLVQAGKTVLVILFQDEDGRIKASTRLEEFLEDESTGFQEGQEVSLVVTDPTDIGVRVVVDRRCWGMVHQSDIFGPLRRGELKQGYIKALREDRKLDIALSAPGYAKIDAIAQGLLDVLKRKGGFLAVTDKSKPEEIYALFGISKKVFKQTLGALYKARLILIEAEGIRIAPPQEG